MKIIDSKGRLFGKLNVVDLLLLLLILVVLFVVVFKLFGTTVQQSIAPEVEMTTTFRIRGAMPILLDELEKSDKRLVNGNIYLDAEIIEVRGEPYVSQNWTADGRVVNATDPYKIDIVIVVKSMTNKGAATHKIGNQEVKSGRTFILKTDTFECSANIEIVEIG